MAINNIAKNINFHYYHTTADKLAYFDYEQGLTEALQRFSVDKVILPTVEKVKRSDSFFILAKYSQQILGGIRLEIKTTVNKLPIENCETKYQSVIKLKIMRLVEQNKTVAELSGLWVSPKAKGCNLGALLIHEATELAFDLGVHSLICMPPLHTLNYFKNLGYKPDQDIPPLAYPDDRYISTVAWLHQESLHSLQLVSSQSTLDNEVELS